MSTRLTLAIPVMNQLQDCKGILGVLRYNTSEDVTWLIVDNGSTDPVEEFLTRYLKPKRLNYVKNKENIGMVPTMQQIYDNCDTEILAVLHNDVFIFEKNWDQRVVDLFNSDPKIGMTGFFGCQGVGPIGERIQDISSMRQAPGWSNMLEAEVHGQKMRREVQPVAIFDGFSMIFRKETLDKSKGFDQRYAYHHYYDRDASLESLRHGYNNVVINVPCHHLSGLTANRSEYQNWVSEKTEGNRGNIHGDKWTHDHNMDLFQEKWSSVLPLYVEHDGVFREGQAPGQFWNFQGEKIRKI